MNIDEWFAEQCGVELGTNNADFIVYETEVTYCYPWDIKDPQCREIVREKFSIETLRKFGKWHADSLGFTFSKGHETIAEAEIACLTAIYEARDKP